MALLQVRSFPDDIYNDLALVAKREHRSVAQQTIVLLRSALGEQDQRKLRRQEFLRELMTEPPVMTGDYPSAADLAREDRDR